MDISIPSVSPAAEMKAGPAAEVIPTPTPAIRRPKISILSETTEPARPR